MVYDSNKTDLIGSSRAHDFGVKIIGQPVPPHQYTLGSGSTASLLNLLVPRTAALTEDITVKYWAAHIHLEHRYVHRLLLLYSHVG